MGYYTRTYDAGFFVYKITNRVNGMLYIGCTTRSIQKRWEMHRNNRLSPKETWKPLYQDMLTYGIDQFSMELLTECVSKFQMRREETRLIWLHNTLWPNGYNLHPGRLRDVI